MALKKGNQTERVAPPPAEGGLSRSQRWARFGSNVAVALVLATILVVAAMWLSSVLLRGRARSDWTASGRFSLSDRSKAILKGLDTDIKLYFVYPNPAGYRYESPEARRSDLIEYERLGDLVESYDLAAGRLTVERVDPLNPVQADACLAVLRETFSEGFARKKELLGEFAAFRKELDAFISKELETLQAFGTLEPTPTAGLLQSLTSAANELVTLSKKAQLQLLGEMFGASLPPADEAATLEEAKTLTAAVGEKFKVFPRFYERVLEAGEEGQFGGPVPLSIKTFLRTASDRYKPLREKAAALQEKVTGRTEEKFDEIEQRLQQQSKFVLVRGPADVKVLGPEEFWARRPSMEEEGQGVFSGERVLTSAVLSLARPEKPAVLFVTRGSPASGWGGPYAQLARRLEGLNFIVQDWDLARGGEMPAPEHMTFPVLVLVPPQADPRMPPPSPEAWAPALDAIEKGTPAVVLAEPATMMSPTVPYRSLLMGDEAGGQDFGIEGRFDAVAVHRRVVDNRGTEKAVPQIGITNYSDHAITVPVGALPTFLLTAMPIMPKEKVIEGITPTPIMLLPTGPDFWADTVAFQAMRGEAERDEADDLIPTREHPIPLAVAVTRELPKEDSAGEAPQETKPRVQRLVIFGDSDFAQDRIAFYRNRFGREMFPGNAEVFLGAVLWVAGQDDLIAVGPETMEARRLGEIPGLLAMRIVLVGVLPALVGIAGIVVLVLRRR